MSEEIEFDKATDEWFKAHNNTPTTVQCCELCGRWYKPSLGHECREVPKDRAQLCDNELIRERFCKRLRKAMNARGLKWNAFAELLGISQPEMAKYSSGKNLPRVERLASMALILGVSTDYLLGLSDKEQGE